MYRTEGEEDEGERRKDEVRRGPDMVGCPAAVRVRGDVNRILDPIS